VQLPCKSLVAMWLRADVSRSAKNEEFATQKSVYLRAMQVLQCKLVYRINHQYLCYLQEPFLDATVH
jgi:hypothetical protein